MGRNALNLSTMGWENLKYAGLKWLEMHLKCLCKPTFTLSASPPFLSLPEKSTSPLVTVHFVTI